MEVNVFFKLQTVWVIVEREGPRHPGLVTMKDKKNQFDVN